MAKNNNANQGWGGPFDFNRDGKVTLDEMTFGLILMKQCKEYAESSSHSPPRKTQKTNDIPTIMLVPEVVDESNYRSLLANYRIEYVSAIAVMVVFLAHTVLILCAVYSAYDPDNSVSIFLAVLFTIAGLIFVGLLLSTTGKSIITSLKNIKLVKQRYCGPVIQKLKK